MCTFPLSVLASPLGIKLCHTAKEQPHLYLCCYYTQGQQSKYAAGCMFGNPAEGSMPAGAPQPKPASPDTPGLTSSRGRLVKPKVWDDGTEAVPAVGEHVCSLPAAPCVAVCLLSMCCSLACTTVVHGLFRYSDTSSCQVVCRACRNLLRNWLACWSYRHATLLRQ